MCFDSTFFSSGLQVTPYHNMTLRGVVHKTILRGNLIYERDRVCDKPTGQLLLETWKGVSLKFEIEIIRFSY